MHLSLFLPNGDIVLIAQTVVCLIYTNVGLIHAIVFVGCIAVPTDLEATIVCLTMPLREADDYAYDARNLKILWQRNIALLIFLRMVYIFDLLNWLSSLIANWK